MSASTFTPSQNGESFAGPLLLTDVAPPPSVNENLANTIKPATQKYKFLPSLLLANVRSICNKDQELIKRLSDSKLEIAFVTETWMTNKNSEVAKSKLGPDQRTDAKQNARSRNKRKRYDGAR